MLYISSESTTTIRLGGRYADTDQSVLAPMSSSPSPSNATISRPGTASATPIAAASAEPIEAPRYRCGPSPEADRNAEVAVPSDETHIARGSACTMVAAISAGVTSAAKLWLEHQRRTFARVISERQHAVRRRVCSRRRSQRECLDAERSEQRGSGASHRNLARVGLAEGAAHRHQQRDPEAIGHRQAA